jgi:hypothetical protein
VKYRRNEWDPRLLPFPSRYQGQEFVQDEYREEMANSGGDDTGGDVVTE